MLPVLAPDDVVLVCPTRTCEIGDIVVAKHPYQEITVIKYVTEIDDNGFLELTSPRGTDSSKFGRPPSKNILGVVTFNLTKKSLIINEKSCFRQGH